MNIKELQVLKAKNEIILKSLKKGRVALASQVSTYLKNKFKYSPAGYPSFKPLIGKKYDISDKSAFNTMINQIHGDLTDLYDADNYINNEILSTCNYYESEKGRLTGILNKLQNDLDAIETIIDDPQVKDGTGETFKDFNQIEFDGNDERNIPVTTSYIDLRTNSASIDAVVTNKIQLNNAKISCQILTEHKSTNQLSDIEYCIGDNSNETWLQEVICEDNNILEYNVGIELEEEVEINTVVYTASSPRKQTITLKLIDKDKNVRTFNSFTTLEKAEWNFKSVSASAIIFGIEKQEADGTDGIEYTYYIGAKNISVYNNTHGEKAVLVSKGDEITRPFSQVAFSVSESVPASTNVSYYVGIDNCNNEVGWMGVERGAVTELNLLPKIEYNFAHDEPDYGTPLGRAKIIGTLEHTPVEKTSTLHVGVDMWQVKSIDINSNTSIKDILNQNIVAFEPMNYVEYNLAPNKAYLYTCFSEFEEPVVLTGKYYYGGTEHTIYVNGTKVNAMNKGSYKEYKLRMAKGVNIIQMFVINDSSNSDKFKFDSYFQDHSIITKAIETATETDLFELEYGLHIDDFSKYCVVDNQLVVNYDPRKYNIEYKAEYRYCDNPELFENAKLRVMAILVTRNTDVTPKVLSYQAATL